MTLTTRPDGICPDCGRQLQPETVAQPAVVRHGGYGATRTTTWLHCPCGYSRHQRTQETRPRGYGEERAT